MSALGSLFRELSAFFEPLVVAATDPWALEQLLAEFGTDSAGTGSAFASGLTALAQALAALDALVATPPDSLATIGAALDAFRAALQAARSLTQTLPGDSAALASELLEFVVLHR